MQEKTIDDFVKECPKEIKDLLLNKKEDGLGVSMGYSRHWYFDANVPAFEGKTPYQMVKEGKKDEVIQILHGIIGGVYL